MHGRRRAGAADQLRRGRTAGLSFARPCQPARRKKIRVPDQGDLPGPAPPHENISLPSSGKSLLELPPSCPTRGALAIVANEGQGAVDVRQRLTSAVLVYGEIVWVRRPGAGVKSAEAKSYADDGGKKAGHQDDIV